MRYQRKCYNIFEQTKDMTTFSSLSFWLFFIIFFIAIFFSFYVPGSFLLKKFRLNLLPHVIVSTITGMSLWGWQGFIFGFLDIRWMTYLYLLIFFFFWIRTDEKKEIFSFIKSFTPKRIKSLDLLLLTLVLVGTIMQLTSAFFTGILTKTGLFFCCMPPDSLYHIALTNQLIKGFPPTEPGMAGVVVHNYHYMSNLVMADLIRIFHLPLIATVYQYFVVLLSLLIGLSAIAFGETIKMKKTYIRWLVFFLYFSGDMTYVLTFLTGRGFNFTTPFLENALWMWVSPPRVFATVVFFAAITLLYLWIKQKKFLIGLLMAFVFASLVSFKIYVGIFMAAGVAGLFIYFLFTKHFKMLLPLIAAGILSLVLYLPVNASSGGLVFTGLWQFQNFVVQPNLQLTHLEMAREIYETHHNWFGVARFETLFIVLYLVFVFGTIILGVFQSKKSLSLFPRELNVFLLSGSIISMIFGFLFIQTSGGANSIQFLITFDILGSIYAALACYYWLDKIRNKVKYVAILVIVLLTIPRIIDIERDYVSQLIHLPSLTIDNNQLQAFQYIKTTTPTNSILLVDNLEPTKPAYFYDAKKKQLYYLPINTGDFWEGNFSYDVSFLTDRSLFIDGDPVTNSIVQSHGVDTAARVTVERTVFLDKNAHLIKTLLHKNNISYIYLGSKTKLAKETPHFLKPIFKNDEVVLLKVT
jgi:hypothetical protein